MNDPKIVVIKRNGTDGPQFPLRTNECLFGRKPECDIRIQLPNVSFEHALVKVDNDRKIKLINLSSSNQTLVNGKSITEAEIKHLDVLTISDRSFRFEFPSPVQEREKSPKIHYNLSNTPTEQKTPKMPTPGGSPRTPPAKESLKENIHILRRHSMPLQEEDEDLASRVPQKTPFSMVDVNTEPSKEDAADIQHVIKTKSSKEQKRRSKRVSFGPVLSPEQFDKDLPPATPLRRGATPGRASLSDDNSLVPLPFSAKKRRSVAALPQSESIQEECDGGEPLDNESPKTRKQQQKIKRDVYTPDENTELSKNLGEQVVESPQSLGHGQEYASPKESELSEIKEGNNPIRRRSSLRLAVKNTSFTELSSSPSVPSSVASPVQSMKEKIEEVMLDSDNYTSDEEEDEFEKTDHQMVETIDAELQELKNKMATPLRAEIKRGLKLRQTKKKMATPLRMEIISGFQLRQTKKKLATPLRREIKSGVQLRKTKKKMATPLRKEIISGIQLRQTKRKMATPVQKEIKSGVQLRQTKKKIATPLKQEIKGGVKLRETKKKMATPLRKEILTGVKLRQTKNKMPTPLRKEITSGVQLRQSKKKMTTPLREEIANGVQLRQTKKKMDTSLQEEIIRGVELRQTMKKIATPLKMEIEEGISLRQTRNKLPTPVRNEIASRPNLRLTKKTMNSRLQDEIKRGSKLRKTKQTMNLELQIEIIKGKKLKSTKKSLPTPVRKQVEEGIVLKHVKTSSKRKRSEDGSQRKKLKLSPINGSADSNEGQNTRQIRPALKTPLRKEIVAGKKLRPTRQRMATPLRKQIHAKPTLRAIRRKSIAATVLTKTVPRKPTYAEIVKRRLKKRTGPRQEITKMDSAPLATTSGVLTRPEASRNAQSGGQSKERRNSTSFNEKKTPRRKSANWMSSLGLALKDAKTHSAPMEDFEGVAEMFATPPASLVAAENPPKKQTKGNWLSSLAKVTNGPRRRVGISTEDLAGIAEMFVTPPSVGRFTGSSVEKAATPGEQGLHSIAAVKPANTPSLRRCEDTRDVKVATPKQNSNASLPSVNADGTSPQTMLHVIEPLKLSKTPSLRHSAEEVVSLQFVTPVHLSRTPSLRSAKKQSSIETNESPALQLDFVSPLESKQTPSFRPADEAETVLLKSVGKQRKDRQSLGFQGLRRLLKSPKQTHSVENSEDLFEASLFTSPKPQPKRFSRKSEGLQGVARLLRTPVENGVTTMGSPKLKGLKALMQETKDFASPHFVGLRNLMRTPKATETVDLEDNFNPELFASAEADSSPAKTDPKPAGQKTKNSRLSIPVLDLTSPEAQEKMDKKEDNIARITRAKRTAPKGLTVPEPKRVRRTRASIQQEKESESENNPKAAEKKTSARVKKNPAANKQTPKRNVFKRTPLDPIFEVPSPGLQSFDNMQQPVTLTPVTQIEKNDAPQEKRQTRRTAVKETKTVGSSLPSCRRGKRGRSEVESSSEESNREDADEGRSAKKSKRDEGRKAGSVVTHQKKVEEKSKEDSEVEGKTLSSPVKPRVTRNRRAEVIPPERKQTNVELTRRSKRGRSKTVEENVSDLKSESTATQRSEDSSSRRRTRNSQAENLTSEEKAGQESVVKLTRRKRGVKPGPLVTREKKVQEESNLDVKVDENEVSSPKEERVTRSRRAEVLPHEEKPVINEARRSKRRSKIVEKNAPVSKSTKSAPSQNSEEYCSSKRSTRNSKPEKIILEETTKAHQDSLVKKTRPKRESKRNASSDPVIKESDPVPSASSQEIQENTHAGRSTRRTRNTSPAEVTATVTNNSRQTKSARNTRSTRQCKQEMESTSRVTRSTKRS